MLFSNMIDVANLHQHLFFSLIDFTNVFYTYLVLQFKKVSFNSIVTFSFI